MNTKHAIVFSMVILMIGSILIVPSANTHSSLTLPLLDLSPEESVRPAADDGLEELKYNVNQNPSFEIMDLAYNWPDTYTGFATSFRSSDPAYTDDANSGTYAGYMASHGVPRGGTSQAYFSRSLGQNPTPVLSSSLTLDFYWNTLANPDIDQGSYLYILIQTTNVTGNYHEIRYYLSNTYFSTSNTSTLTCYLWNFSTDSWHHFSRDLSADYAANPLNSPADTTRRVQEIYWYASSASFCDDKLEVLLDDVTLSNGTYSGWLPNGGFETGNGQYWGYNQGTPTFVTQSTESTNGIYSLNMTTGVVASSSYADGAVERNFQYPDGQYCNAPGETVIEFDWKFGSVSGIANQYASFEITFVNETNSYVFHLFLGFGDDTFSGFINTSNHFYIPLEGFNVRDTWHSAQLDMYDFISGLGSTAGTITEFQFYIYAPSANAQVSLLVDDFLVITSPSGDPGFEIDWFEDSWTPFAAWNRYQGDSNTILRSTDSFSGNYACNLTPLSTIDDFAGVIRSTYLNVGSDDFLNLWWRLDAMSNADEAVALVKLELDGGRSLNYIIGSAGNYNPTNSSNNLYFEVAGYNETGSWTNLHRNITSDVNEGLSLPDDIQLTAVVIRVRSDHVAPTDSKVTLIVDDVIITDGAPPTINEVDQLTSTPMYYDDVHIHIDAIDTRPGVEQVLVNYTIDGGSNWQSVLATGVYDAIIPAQVYNTTVEYFVIAVDGVGLEGIDNNGGLYYSYTVDDDVDPTLSIDTPTNLSDVEGVVTIATTVDDLGSGVDYVQFIIDTGIPIEVYIAPFSYNWNTDEVALGPHDIEVVVHDLAGNTQSEKIDVTVIDSIPPSITGPDDFEFVEGGAGVNITWYVSDLHANTFDIFWDGSLIHSDAWTLSPTIIEIDVDTIGQGIHNVTLVVFDAAGNTATDTVIVTVTPHYFTEPETTTDPTTSSDSTTTTDGGGDTTTPLVIIAVVGVGGILIVVFVVLPVLKKR